ncbi:tail protein X [uncultured Dialister sp.]|uniref:tail protein X n=1 Tax=uncultured Dialister sp. TaxID=278064 RepID=UPI0027DADA77|nr:tail protein X [uncultured Dialister sp.]
MSNTYITVQGDMWDSIAKKVYGSEAGMNKLIEANHQYIDMVVFPAGLTLAIPSWETPKTDMLPPWRR